jgi:23S rRNA (uracil1939-C5)-methyltransferase
VEGKAIFVPFTLPGERVEANLSRDQRSFGTAELVAVLDPSGDRTAAPCPYFGSCGGCQYQHAAYAAQLAMKQGILRETLERAHVGEIPQIEVIAGEPFGYRNRVRLHVERNPFSLCYKFRDSHRNLPVATCPIAAPELQQAIAILNGEGGALELGDWAKEVEFFSAGGSRLLVSFFTSRSAGQAEKALAKLWPGLQDRLPGVAGIAAFSMADGRVPGRRLGQVGEESLRYPAEGLGYQVSFGSFFQTNRFLVDALVKLVTEEERGAAAWDLYAGVGLFSLPLAQKFTSVTAVESSGTAVRDLHANLRASGSRVVAAETDSFLRHAIEQKMPAPDLVVVDPPRAGLGKAVTIALGKLRPRKITYVSCDPATLGRDLAALLESGYRLRKLHLVDLFPQTFHLESVTHLSLG